MVLSPDKVATKDTATHSLGVVELLFPLGSVSRGSGSTHTTGAGTHLQSRPSPAENVVDRSPAHHGIQSWVDGGVLMAGLWGYLGEASLKREGRA